MVRKAKEIGLNVSKISENALKEVIEKILSSNLGKVTGPAGFEPATSGSGDRRSIHSELRAPARELDSPNIGLLRS